MTNQALSNIVGARFERSQNHEIRNGCRGTVLRKLVAAPRCVRHLWGGSLPALLVALRWLVPRTPSQPTSSLSRAVFAICSLEAAGTGKIDLTDNPLLDNPNIDGYRYKQGWGKIQPDNAATFNWASIDSAIAIAAAHGKKLCISISGVFHPRMGLHDCACGLQIRRDRNRFRYRARSATNRSLGIRRIRING